MTPDAIAGRLQAVVAAEGPALASEISPGMITVTVPPQAWVTALACALDELDCDFFDWLTGVDELDAGLAVLAHVYSLAGRHHLLLRTLLAGEPRLATATGVYRGAAWHERETHEMFGVVFDGHPGLDPLLLPEGFDGVPLRKDFVLAARREKDWPGAKEPGEQGGARGAPDPGARDSRRVAGLVSAELPARSRGVIGLLEENCTVCMLCARECPDWCIYIDSHKEPVPSAPQPSAPEQGAPEQGGAQAGPGAPAAGGPAGRGRQRVRNALDRFAIDFSLCMYCGICIEVCPYDALFWAPEFSYAEPDLRDLTHERGRLKSWMDTVPPPPAHDPGAPPPKELLTARPGAVPGRGADG